MRPSAGIGVVGAQKLEVFFSVFVGARDPLQGSAWSRCKNSRFFALLRRPDEPCGDRRGRRFFAFLRCPDEPSAGIGVVEGENSRFFAFLTFPDEPSAEIVRVEALSLWRRANSSKSRRTLSGDHACRSALAVAPCDFVAREMAFGSCLVVCAPRGSSGLKIAAFEHKRSTRRAPAAPAGKSQLLSTDVVCGACSRSSGWKIATFKYRRSMRSVLPQLRLENRNF